MAFHNSTPESVLNAPCPTVGVLWLHTGPNRYDRRHATTRTGARPFIPKARQIPASNLPYVRPRKGGA